MYRLDVRHIGVALLAAAIAGLVERIGEETDWGRALTPSTPAMPTQAPLPTSLSLLDDFSQPSLDKHYTQTLERPLFVPTRRPAPPLPPPPPPPPPPKPTMQKGQFQLAGAMILPETSYVILRDVASGKMRRVEKGQTINGILVEAVEAEQVVLSQYDDSEVVTMKVAPSPAAPMSQPVQSGQAVSPPASAARAARFSRVERSARAVPPVAAPASPDTPTAEAKVVYEGEKRFDNPLLRGWQAPGAGGTAGTPGK